MDLEITVSLYAGGAGSGCKGPNCGRPVTMPKGSAKLPVLDLKKYAPLDHPVMFQGKKYPLMRVRVKDLRGDVLLGRQSASSAKAINEYKDQIRRGEYEPIAVSVHPGGQLFVSDGAHRTTAAHSIGAEFIVAKVNGKRK